LTIAALDATESTSLVKKNGAADQADVTVEMQNAEEVITSLYSFILFVFRCSAYPFVEWLTHFLQILFIIVMPVI